LAANDNRLAPPPFWYFETKVMARPDRQEIELDEVKRALKP
jgi:hypothetical protein